ncbi:MAG: tetratricopeptide repeat protein [Candidatus Brocadiales bacterium]
MEEFVGEDSAGMSQYYDLLERDLEPDQLKKGMRRLIKKDPMFFDPYLELADILEEEGNHEEARKLLKDAYVKAVRLISDRNGNWPKALDWGFLENRHIIRAIARWAHELWGEGRPELALEIYRRLLKSNPNDNIGARYEILAIRMGYNSNYSEKLFSGIGPGFVDADKSDEWFEKNARKFPEEFEWWFKEVGE